ncbi:hypothetical protein A9Q79_03105 [Methylophaga sp. 42_25_T18]|nr:hypothetical protein A9Q79_03105 [Methylophaga sp. 42_25_T18]
MVTLQIESWAAIAPGLETKEDWRRWLKKPTLLPEGFSKDSFRQIPPMLRRRFTTLGRCAVTAGLKIMDEGQSIPSIFSSRYGDTAISLSLLEQMGMNEPMSPSNFSLAVHNAVGGLFSIVRKDTSKVTSITAVEGFVVNTLLEAVGQLQESDRVLCVIYDIPLPELYQRYCDSDLFPYAIAMILNKTGDEQLKIEQIIQPDNIEKITENSQKSEALQLINMLTGLSSEMNTKLNGVIWKLTRTVCNGTEKA